MPIVHQLHVPVALIGCGFVWVYFGDRGSVHNFGQHTRHTRVGRLHALPTLGDVTRLAQNVVLAGQKIFSHLNEVVDLRNPVTHQISYLTHGEHTQRNRPTACFGAVVQDGE